MEARLVIENKDFSGLAQIKLGVVEGNKFICGTDEVYDLAQTEPIPKSYKEFIWDPFGHKALQTKSDELLNEANEYIKLHPEVLNNEN